MIKVYNEQVRQKTKEIIDVLIEVELFAELKGTTEFAEKYLGDVLTNKFIKGLPLDLGTEQEVEAHIERIITGSVYYELKEKGYLDSYEDEETPEVFFMTEKGKLLNEKFKANPTGTTLPGFGVEI